jgi:hypothetical protein
MSLRAAKKWLSARGDRRPELHRHVARSENGLKYQSALLTGRPKSGPLRQVVLQFVAGRLYRLRLKSRQPQPLDQRALGSAHYVLGAERYWLDGKRLRGIRCENTQCEVYDLTLLVGRAGSRAQIARQFQRVYEYLEQERGLPRNRR